MSEVQEIQLPGELLHLTNAIDANAEKFTCGSDDIRAAALQATKYLFDSSLESEGASIAPVNDLLSSLNPSCAPRTRSQARNAKRKRERTPPPAFRFEQTPLASLFVEGMDEDQVWAQLELRAKNMCDMLEVVLEGEVGEEEDSDLDGKNLRQALKALQEEGELPGEDEMDVDEERFAFPDSDEDEDSEDSDEDDEDDEDKDEDDDGQILGEEFEELRDPSSSEDDDDDELDLNLSSMLDEPRKSAMKKPLRKGKGGHPVLDDDFFSLSSFNAETEEVEARKASKGRLSKGSLEEDDDDEESDEDSIDLFVPVDEEENLDVRDMEEEKGGLMYRDFFEPPPRPPSKKGKQKATEIKSTEQDGGGKVRFHEEVKVKKIKPKGKGLPTKGAWGRLGGNGEDEDEDDDDDYGFGGAIAGEDEAEDHEGGDVESEDTSDESEGSDDEEESEEEGDVGAIERLKDDLFAEDEDTPQLDLSAHEKRMLALKSQIEELEAENVGPKDWTLMGEATSRSRPENSLLEEDLEFERVMKAVPVITGEVVQALEERIKARILENNFDDVVRIRPVDDKPFLPSRMFELKDTKSTQSLAQIYEGEYQAAATGTNADDRDGKLKKEHSEIEKQWESICSKLDALCNAHFVPKQPKVTISTVSNVASTSMESALPTTQSASTMLAPEEVFAPSTSDLRSKSEMTPTEKKSLRARQRKSNKKMRDAMERNVDKFARKVKGVGGAKQEKKKALESVVKTGKGVTVIGKKKDVIGKGKGKRRN